MRGGNRPGAGRKPSGKKRIVMYGTADEEAALRKKLVELRQKSETICRPKICPNCGKPMKIKTGSRGDFWGCSGYPECNHTESI